MCSDDALTPSQHQFHVDLQTQTLNLLSLEVTVDQVLYAISKSRLTQIDITYRGDALGLRYQDL